MKALTPVIMRVIVNWATCVCQCIPIKPMNQSIKPSIVASIPTRIHTFKLLEGPFGDSREVRILSRSIPKIHGLKLWSVSERPLCSHRISTQFPVLVLYVSS